MKIGLIAMSGIRVCDAELLRLGLTLPGFVERSKAIASLPSLGLLTLAGMTPPEHELSYLEVPDVRAMEELPNGFDLVGISSYTAQIDEAYELSDRYRALGAEVVLGGPHVSCLPEEAGAHCDSVVVGHGELHWPDLLADASKGRMKPLYGRLGQDFDLAEAPRPAFERLDIARYNRLTVQTSRGCPHRCEFCGGSVLFAPRYRQKPAEKVLAEIDRVRELWPAAFVELADDNTFVDRDYWLDLLPELKKRNFRWFAETDISVADDEGLLTSIREGGCVEVLIGLESPVQGGLDGVELRGNWKRDRWPGYREALRNIQSHGIRVNGCFVLGLDGHGPGIFDEVRDFVREADLYDVQVTVQTPFPGTPLRARLQRERRLAEGAWGRCTLFDVTYVPLGMTASELEAGFRNLVVDIYSDAWTQERRSRFDRSLRAYRRTGRAGGKREGCP